MANRVPYITIYRPSFSIAVVAVGSTNHTQDPGNLKSPLSVAYQGVPGAYSEGAALKACPGWEPLPCAQFETAFQALSQWMAEKAVLPIENSLGGSIHQVYDLLLRYRLHIVGEVTIKPNHCLLALPGVAKGSINRVISHPQAPAQFDQSLRTRMDGVLREAVDDTAGAAQAISEAGDAMRDTAAIASRRAAELYGLEILDEGIQDNKDNITRFIVLSRDPLVHTGHEGNPKGGASQGGVGGGKTMKTSVVFSLREGPGQLFKALSVFALRDIDMTKIESRPLRSEPILIKNERGRGVRSLDAISLDEADGNASGGEGEIIGRRLNYLFYVDFVGSLADEDSQNALRHLQEIAPFMRVLGSYPMDLTLGQDL